MGSSWKYNYIYRQFMHSLAFGLGAKFGKWDEYYPNHSTLSDLVYLKYGDYIKGVSPVFTVKCVIGICW